MKKCLLPFLLAAGFVTFTACESKSTDNTDNHTTVQENTDAAEGNEDTGVGATGTANETGTTGTAADTAQEHDHSDPNHTH